MTNDILKSWWRKMAKGAGHLLTRTGPMAVGINPGWAVRAHVDALATGAEPQYRVIRNAPKGVGRDELRPQFRAAMRYW